MATLNVADVAAQSFWKKVGKAVEKEAVNQINKRIGNQSDKEKTSKRQPQETQRTQQAQAQQPQKSRTNKIHQVPTTAALVPYGPTTGKLNGHQWVDMGLPSGTRWATCNVDATLPEQAGKHYAWGETVVKTSYTQATCKHYGKSVADISGNKVYDVASAKWGAGWRIPTQEEFSELAHYCHWKYVQKNGRWGAEFTSPKTKNTLFLPATGSKEGTSLHEASGCGMYWTSTPYQKEGYYNGAHEYHFGGALGEMGIAERYYGYAVRPVTNYTVKTEIPSSGEINGYKWVDLGLPSGLKWATYNLGSKAVDQDGSHYAWGETIPQYREEFAEE